MIAPLSYSVANFYASSMALVLSASFSGSHTHATNLTPNLFPL